MHGARGTVVVVGDVEIEVENEHEETDSDDGTFWRCLSITTLNCILYTRILAPRSEYAYAHALSAATLNEFSLIAHR